MTLWRPQLATVHVPTIPAIAGQLRTGEDAQQPVGGVRHQHFAGNPVPDGAGRDMQHLRSGFGSEAQISKHDFEPCAEHLTVLASLGGLLTTVLVLYTMYIMLSLYRDSIIAVYLTSNCTHGAVGSANEAPKAKLPLPCNTHSSLRSSKSPLASSENRTHVP